jgi:type IV pilus assembly protein PilQ
MMYSLLLTTCLWASATPSARRVTLDVKDADVHNVLRLLADIGRVNVVVPDDVKGRVTVKLENVPWTQALDVVLHSKGLGQERLGNIIHVDLLERIHHRAAQRAEIEKSRRESAELMTVMIPLSYARAADLKPMVEALLTERGRVAVDVRTNVLIVTDVVHNVERVRSELGL